MPARQQLQKTLPKSQTSSTLAAAVTLPDASATATTTAAGNPLININALYASHVLRPHTTALPLPRRLMAPTASPTITTRNLSNHMIINNNNSYGNNSNYNTESITASRSRLPPTYSRRTLAPITTASSLLKKKPPHTPSNKNISPRLSASSNSSPTVSDRVANSSFNNTNSSPFASVAASATAACSVNVTAPPNPHITTMHYHNHHHHPYRQQSDFSLHTLTAPPTLASSTQKPMDSLPIDSRQRQMNHIRTPLITVPKPIQLPSKRSLSASASATIAIAAAADEPSLPDTARRSWATTCLSVVNTEASAAASASHYSSSASIAPTGIVSFASGTTCSPIIRPTAIISNEFSPVKLMGTHLTAEPVPTISPPPAHSLSKNFTAPSRTVDLSKYLTSRRPRTPAVEFKVAPSTPAWRSVVPASPPKNSYYSSIQLRHLASNHHVGRGSLCNSNSNPNSSKGKFNSNSSLLLPAGVLPANNSAPRMRFHVPITSSFAADIYSVPPGDFASIQPGPSISPHISKTAINQMPQQKAPTSSAPTVCTSTLLNRGLTQNHQSDTQPLVTRTDVVESCDTWGYPLARTSPDTFSQETKLFSALPADAFSRPKNVAPTCFPSSMSMQPIIYQQIKTPFPENGSSGHLPLSNSTSSNLPFEFTMEYPAKINARATSTNAPDLFACNDTNSSGSSSNNKNNKNSSLVALSAPENQASLTSLDLVMERIKGLMSDSSLGQPSVPTAPSVTSSQEHGTQPNCGEFSAVNGSLDQKSNQNGLESSCQLLQRAIPKIDQRLLVPGSNSPCQRTVCSTTSPGPIGSFSHGGKQRHLRSRASVVAPGGSRSPVSKTSSTGNKTSNCTSNGTGNGATSGVADATVSLRNGGVSSSHLSLSASSGPSVGLSLPFAKFWAYTPIDEKTTPLTNSVKQTVLGEDDEDLLPTINASVLLNDLDDSAQSKTHKSSSSTLPVSSYTFCSSLPTCHRSVGNQNESRVGHFGRDIIREPVYSSIAEHSSYISNVLLEQQQRNNLCCLGNNSCHVQMQQPQHYNFHQPPFHCFSENQMHLQLQHQSLYNPNQQRQRPFACTVQQQQKLPEFSGHYLLGGRTFPEGRPSA